MDEQQPKTSVDFEHQPLTPEEFKAFNMKVIVEFRSGRAVMGGVLEGASLLLLSTTGARTGLARLTPLAFFTLDARMIVVGSYGGATADPAWVHNLRADPHARVELSEESYAVRAKELPRDERDPLYARIAAAVPRFADYEASTSRVIPVFELIRTERPESGIR